MAITGVIRPGAGYVDIVLNCTVSGQLLYEELKSIKARFKLEVRCQSYESDFVIRVSGASAVVAEQLREIYEVENREPRDSEMTPQILYVKDGVAYADPAQRMTVHDLMVPAHRLTKSKQYFCRVFLKGNALAYCFASTWRDIDTDASKELAEAMSPWYTFTSTASAGVHEGRIYIQLTVPRRRGKAAAADLMDVKFVRTDPPPTVVDGYRDDGQDYIWFFPKADPDATVEELYVLAAKACLLLNVFPVGDFIYFARELVDIKMHPLTVSRR